MKKHKRCFQNLHCLNFKKNKIQVSFVKHVFSELNQYEKHKEKRKKVNKKSKEAV